MESNLETPRSGPVCLEIVDACHSNRYTKTFLLDIVAALFVIAASYFRKGSVRRQARPIQTRWVPAGNQCVPFNVSPYKHDVRPQTRIAAGEIVEVWFEKVVPAALG